MRRSPWPVVLVTTGLLLIAGGFIYDLLFAGIPYQDPTPEMSARYALHSRIASVIYLAGAGGFLTGAAAVAYRLVVRMLPS